MKKIIFLFFSSCIGLFGQSSPPTTGRNSGGGAPNVTIVSPGVAPTTISLVNDTVYQFGKGLNPVTPSIWSSNLAAGNTLTAWFIGDKTNLTFQGVAGGSVIDGSAQIGDVVCLSNCYNIRFSGMTVRGMTNHNPIALPITMNTWGAISYAKTENLFIDNCIIERHADHGILDASLSLGAGYVSRVSTNVYVRDNYLTDIGGFRTNNAGGMSQDGTAIVPTGGFIERNIIENVHRGIEPYADTVSPNQIFNVTIRGNYIHNAINAGIVNFSTTNNHYSVCEDNILVNDPAFNYHGTNYGVTFAWVGTGIFITGGKGWRVQNNHVRGGWLYGYALFNSASKLDDLTLTDNEAVDINSAGSQGVGFYLGDPANSVAAATSLRRATIARNKAIRTQESGFAVWAGRDIRFFDNEAYNVNLANSSTYLGAGMLFGYDGFSSALLTNLNCWNNTVYSDTANAPRIPFYLADNISSGSFVDFRSITNGGATAASASNGITNRSGNNVTILGPVRTYNSSVNLASIGINSAVDTVISAAGVTTNDAVTVQIPPQFWVGGAAAEVSLFAWATNSTSSDGQIVLRAINADTTAATVDFPAVNMIFQARQVRVAGQ